jgi:hypothetical protein
MAHMLAAAKCMTVLFNWRNLISVNKIGSLSVRSSSIGFLVKWGVTIQDFRSTVYEPESDNNLLNEL